MLAAITNDSTVEVSVEVLIVIVCAIAAGVGIYLAMLNRDAAQKSTTTALAKLVTSQGVSIAKMEALLDKLMKAEYRRQGREDSSVIDVPRSRPRDSGSSGP